MVQQSVRTLQMLAAEDQSTKYHDPIKDQTYGRRLANLFYLNGCYNPSIKIDEDRANLTKAWEYFEHHMLPRYIVPSLEDTEKEKVSGGKRRYNRADIGEHDKDTRLYPIWSTPIEDLADFGVGCGLYFDALRFLAIVTFITGCINLPIITYFYSDAYVGNDSNRSLINDIGMLGSAICVETSWEMCPSCTEDDWKTFPSTTDRFTIGTKGGESMPFIKKNLCNVTDVYGIVSIVTLVFIFCAVYFWLLTQKKRIKLYDKEEHSSKDFSIEIKNPPQVESSYDPEVWKKWLDSTFDVNVMACTIALDNHDLTKALIKRRQLINQFREMLDDVEDFDIDDLESNVEKARAVPTWKQVLFRADTPESVRLSIEMESIKIDELVNNVYKISSIIVTFQTEDEKVKVMNRLVVPILRPSWVPKEYQYQYVENDQHKVRLKVVEPAEPSAIRWEDLNVSFLTRMMLIIITTAVSFGLIIGGGAIIYIAHEKAATSASLVITILNIFTPMIVRLLTSFESHRNESSIQASEYLKVTAIRWTNTVLVMVLITPFTDTLQNGDFLITYIFAIFMFDIFTSPALQLLDIFGNLGRHVFGPRKTDQRRMNLSFQASPFDIGDKYTNVTRIFFFTLFYSSIFPSGYFFASAIFAMAYWFDKFSILRSHGQGAKIGPQVSKLSNFFFLLCLATCAITVSHSFAQFPFDNACETENLVEGTNYGQWELSDGSVDMSDGNVEHQFCNQHIFTKFSFPPIPSIMLEGSEGWMNEAQNTFSYPLFWSMIGIIVIIIMTFFLWFLSSTIYALFFRRSRPVKHEQIPDKKFDNIIHNPDLDVQGYIPQVFIGGYVFPFLLCDTDKVHRDLIGWKDPYTSYDSHNLIYDIPQMAHAKEKFRSLRTDATFASNEFVDNELASLENEKVFSAVKSWVNNKTKPAEINSNVMAKADDDVVIIVEEDQCGSTYLFCRD